MFAKLPLIALVSALASAAVIPPATSKPNNANKYNAAQANANLLVCVDLDLHGSCAMFAYTTGVCYNLPTSYNDAVSSVTPEGDGHACTLYQDVGCTGPSFTVVQYERWLSGFNDVASSFLCSA
ncbi:hypothetical protein BDQ12DRAFT_677637 [Crucibulum laeve]|uniref:Beta/gamma crystallin 'Greek key' domain-containing protein n=1 Tax=Crucibulum laeve TaxID=68775 RepID=A0A5C3M9G4_9AGAR|nr:hypothetical protein BDQ12DRAFT_677637 [Crucibulum laeve]